MRAETLKLRSERTPSWVSLCGNIQSETAKFLPECKAVPACLLWQVGSAARGVWQQTSQMNNYRFLSTESGLQIEA